VYSTSDGSLQQLGNARISGKPITAVTINSKQIVAVAADGVEAVHDVSSNQTTKCDFSPAAS
jgi:hypothetical protein